MMLRNAATPVDEVVRAGVAKLRDDGYVVLESFLARSFLEDLYISYLRRIGAPVAYGGRVGRSVDKENVAYIDFPLTLHANAVKLAVAEPIIGIVERYLGIPVVLSHSTAYRTHVIGEQAFREALRKPGEFSGWHSDANILSPNRGYRCVVVMTYLTDVEPGTGGLELVRGSHQYGGHKRAWSDADVRQRSADVVEICAPAGSLVIFDMEMIHRAGIPHDRARDIIRYMYVPEGGYTEPLVLSNSTLPLQISPEAARVLRLGRPSTVDLPVSDGPPVDGRRSLLRQEAKRWLRPLLARVGYYR